MIEKAANKRPLKIFEKIMPMFTVIVTNYSYDEQKRELARLSATNKHDSFN